MNNTLYLASGSPRRRELLAQLGFELIRLYGDIDETPYAGEDACDYVERMAREKNDAALAQWHTEHAHEPPHPVLSADTTVALQGKILGKPADDAEAEAMLHALSGSTHQVLSAVCVYWQGRQHVCVQCSEVTFADLSDEDIRRYIASGEPHDKAGAYGIQGLGGLFVTHLSGSFTGVMGLPLFETAQLLRQCGICLPT
ncbi:septum formation protein [Neisseria sp. HSC-16F19]|nr:Maf family protein [Neisseria sp. HSC-16F19]MCP2041831.1 septum formation protein [Neisseria sp. HSC-16F19]